MERKAERRRQPRDPISIALSVLCTDHEGRESVMHAKLLDISVSGARLSILQKIPPQSAITFYYHKLAIGGRGTVRFCRPGKKGYEVGIEFPNGTGWNPALREKADLLNLGAAITQQQPAPAEAAATEVTGSAETAEAASRS